MVRDEVGIPLSKIKPFNYEDKFMTEVVGNPIHVFLLCQRTSTLISEIIKKIKIKDSSNLKARLTNEVKGVSWCDQEDVVGSIVSLVRVQQTYMLDPVDIAKGFLYDKQTKAIISPDHCLFIAKNRLEKTHRLSLATTHELAVAIEWLEAAHKLSLESKPSQKSKSIKDLVLEKRILHDKIFRPPKPRNEPSLYPNSDFFIEKLGQDLEKKSARSLRLKEDAEFRRNRISLDIPARKSYLPRDFEHLCRGLTLKRESSLVKLGKHCYLWTRGNPYFFIQPIKLEVLSIDPLLWVFHKFVSKKDVNRLIKLGKDNVQRATTRSVHKGKHVVITRTQSNAWVTKPPQDILRKMDCLTGLQVSRQNSFSFRNINEFYEAEFIQVGVYGSGGMYTPHLDTLTSIQNPQLDFSSDGIFIGDRMATAMVYLSDVAGGGTAFPKLGASAFPSRGNVVFWYNFYRNGTQNDLMLHGACPTIYGIKWVANEWIRAGSQIFARPCSLVKNE